MKPRYTFMKFDVRPMTETERMYSYTQTVQIMAQSGCIGHLRGNMDSGGCALLTSWDDHRGFLKSDEFKAEFDNVIGNLRYDYEYDGMLSNLDFMRQYCYKHPESDYGNEREYGFRVDTEKYSYMLRLNPNHGEYNIYCYCYVKAWLEDHMKSAEAGIRFINPRYEEQFRLPDGGKIRITDPDGRSVEHVCRYIDGYHMEVSDIPYHICEFAEITEENGAKVEPITPVIAKEIKKKNHDER